jgi:hypothetical protein
MVASAPLFLWKRRTSEYLKRIAVKDIYSDKGELKDPDEMASFFDTFRRQHHRIFLGYITTLLLCLAIAFAQIAFMDAFLDGKSQRDLQS